MKKYFSKKNSKKKFPKKIFKNFFQKKLGGFQKFLIYAGDQTRFPPL
jgi:hypothetical protein